VEIAKLVLAFVSILIWPIVILCIGLRFRNSIDRMMDRISRESRQIDLEIGGQKISVKLAEKLLTTALEEVAGDGTGAPVSLAQVKHDTLHILRLMSSLRDEDAEVMRLLSVNMSDVTTNSDASQRSAIDRLRQLGLVKMEGSHLEITDLGQKVRNLLGEGDLQQALHKISQAM
jgi:hypothetical protein